MNQRETRAIWPNLVLDIVCDADKEALDEYLFGSIVPSLRDTVTVEEAEALNELREGK